MFEENRIGSTMKRKKGIKKMILRLKTSEIGSGRLKLPMYPTWHLSPPQKTSPPTFSHYIAHIQEMSRSAVRGANIVIEAFEYDLIPKSQKPACDDPDKNVGERSITIMKAKIYR